MIGTRSLRHQHFHRGCTASPATSATSATSTMRPGAFVLLLRPTDGEDFEVLLQYRAKHLKNPQTWGLVGGQLEHDEWWIYDSPRVSEELRRRVLRRAALREALEEMGAVPEGSKMPYTPIIFEPMCVQVAADGQAMRLPRQERRWPVPAGLSFLENDPHRSKQLRVENSQTYVFVYLAKDEDRSFVEIVKEEVRSRTNRHSSGMELGAAVACILGRALGREENIGAGRTDLGKPREIELHIMDYVDSHGAVLRQMAEAGRIQQAEACLMLPQEPNSMDRAGETAALKACRRGHMEMMQLLCYADADAWSNGTDEMIFDPHLEDFCDTKTYSYFLMGNLV
eukprot:s744_g26.t1